MIEGQLLLTRWADRSRGRGEVIEWRKERELKIIRKHARREVAS
jgi:hypothetical protein